LDKTYNCLSCAAECKCGHSKRNKYCSVACQREYEYHNKWKPLVEAGKLKDGSSPVKRYILERDDHTCTECGCGEEYNGMPLVLTIDHIDGNSDNNFPDNLRTLCPNCHSQTTTFKGRNRKNSARNKYMQQYRTRVV
jgi:5-methylcytosine-specific restriction endonuclease McrA